MDIGAGVSYIAMFLVVLVFMPLSALTFISYFMARKEKEFVKATEDMGINTRRSVWDVYKGTRYILPVMFATLVCLVGALNMQYIWKYNEPEFRSYATMEWAFLGGFCFSTSVIIQRIVAYDLPPNVYYSSAIRLILSVLLSGLLSFILPGEDGWVNLTTALPAVGFLTGFFPDSILTWLIKRYNLLFNPNTLNEEILSLNNIEGMSTAHRDRLNEANIANAQNLASASLTQLLIETPYNSRTLLDWIGQAKLLCYAKGHMPQLRDAGIRTVYDLMTPDKTATIMVKMAEAISVNPILMQNIFAQVNTDKGIVALDIFQKKLNGSPDANEDATAGNANWQDTVDASNGSQTIPAETGAETTDSAFDTNVPAPTFTPIPVEEDPRGHEENIGVDIGPPDLESEERHPLDVPQDLNESAETPEETPNVLSDDTAVG